MDADLLVHSTSQVLTLQGGPQRGMQLGQLGLVDDGAVAIGGERILAVGRTAELRAQFRARLELDAGGNAVLPGFVDPHTHLIWMGDRAGEFELRIAGASYMEILAAGGGILSTVRHTRAATVDELKAAARPRLRRMLAHGTTTAEAKTGYGLETEAELRQLQAILELDQEGPLELVPTFLGAHAIPEEYQAPEQGEPDRSDAYVDRICREMLPRLERWWQERAVGRPRPFVDVFCEVGAFDLSQTRRILEAARGSGLPAQGPRRRIREPGRHGPGGGAGGSLGGPSGAGDGGGHPGAGPPPPAWRWRCPALPSGWAMPNSPGRGDPAGRRPAGTGDRSQSRHRLVREHAVRHRPGLPGPAPDAGAGGRRRHHQCRRRRGTPGPHREPGARQTGRLAPAGCARLPPPGISLWHEPCTYSDQGWTSRLGRRKGQP